MSQADVVKSVEGSGLKAGIAFLEDLNSVGGAIDLELKELAASLGAFGGEMVSGASPLIHQVIASLISKLKAPAVALPAPAAPQV